MLFQLIHKFKQAHSIFRRELIQCNSKQNEGFLYYYFCGDIIFFWGNSIGAGSHFLGQLQGVFNGKSGEKLMRNGSPERDSGADVNEICLTCFAML